jgi:hypothetical protein
MNLKEFKLWDWTEMLENYSNCIVNDLNTFIGK